ncbi:MAG: winged helix-turn-helix domain-containing protein, partial [Beijerinckiaceae bacterium]
MITVRRGVTLRRVFTGSAVIGARVAETHGVAYSHAGLLALLHRLGRHYRKPEMVSPRLDAAKQKA